MIEHIKRHIVGFVIGVIVTLIVVFVFGASNANASGLKVLETAIEVESDFTDISGTSLNDTKIVHKGEIDFDLFLIDWDAVTGWDNGEFRKGLIGSIGAYVRIYTLKGGALEFLGGINQPIHEGVELDNVRTLRFVVRKPL